MNYLLLRFLRFACVVAIASISFGNGVAEAAPKKVLILFGSLNGDASGMNGTTIYNETFIGSNSISELFSEMSYGEISFTGEVHGPYPVTMTGDCYSYKNSVRDSLISQAVGDSVVLSDFDIVQFLFPEFPGCSTKGNYSHTTNPPMNFVTNGEGKYAAARAYYLGLSVGLGSAAYDRKVLFDKGSVTGSMGWHFPSTAALVQANAFQKFARGWISPNPANEKFVEVSSSTAVTLIASERK